MSDGMMKGMALVLHDTLTRRKQPFVPVSPGRVRMYNCGPTVYAAQSATSALSCSPTCCGDSSIEGIQGHQVMNITDVGHMRDDDVDSGEDKIERRAEEETRWQIADEVHEAVLRVPRALDFRPTSTPGPPTTSRDGRHHRGLLEKGSAYQSDGNVYFEIENSRVWTAVGNTPDELEGRRARQGNDEKRDPPTSRSGRRTQAPHAVGLAPGAAASPAGTSSARRWSRDLGEARSTSTRAARTTSFPPRDARSRRPRAPSACPS